jgi:hypothetical protein
MCESRYILYASINSSIAAGLISKFDFNASMNLSPYFKFSVSRIDAAMSGTESEETVLWTASSFRSYKFFVLILCSSTSASF